MQTIFNHRYQNGYLTVYLSLLFGIVLSLLLALIEGAAIGAARLQAELVADLGVDSVFAEYNRELLSRYGLFFIDDSYGSDQGSISKVEKHLEDYMNYNMSKTSEFSGYTSFLQIANPYLEIEEAAFATDNSAEVWKAQAVKYIKDMNGLSLITELKDMLLTVSGQQLITRNIEAEMEQNKQQIVHAMNEKTIEEREQVQADSVTEQGFSLNHIIDCIDAWKGQGVLSLVMPQETMVSTQVIDSTNCISHRYAQNQYSKGSGLPDYVDKPNGITDELLYGEYLMKMLGCYGVEKENTTLAYEIEYVIFGKDKDIYNLRECAERLLAIREVSNYIYLSTMDSAKQTEAQIVAIIICTLCLIPECTEALKQIILALWACAEAVVDVKCLMQGGKVSLIKTKEEWNLGLQGLFSGDYFQSLTGKGSEKVLH